jgi:hypothetical protein
MEGNVTNQLLCPSIYTPSVLLYLTPISLKLNYPVSNIKEYREYLIEKKSYKKSAYELLEQILVNKVKQALDREYCTHNVMAV